METVKIKLIAKFHHTCKEFGHHLGIISSWEPSTNHWGLRPSFILNFHWSFHHSSCIRCSDLHIPLKSYHPRSTKHSANCFLSSIWQKERGGNIIIAASKSDACCALTFHHGSVPSNSTFEFSPTKTWFPLPLAVKTSSVFATHNLSIAMSTILKVPCILLA